MAGYFKKGISTIEIMIAIVLMTLCLSSVVLLIFQSQEVIVQNPQILKTLRESKNILAVLRDISHSAFSTITTTASTTIINRNEFTKDVYVSDFIKSTFIDPDGAVGGSTCSIHSWGNTVLGGTISILNAIPTDLDARDGLIYMTVNPTLATSSDLYIIDARDPDNPEIVSSLNTGPGLQAIHSAGRYAYVANRSINAQLQIVDIIDPYNPRLVSSYKLPGTYTDGTTIGTSILYYKNHVYLGSPKSQIAELHDIDVSDPRTPREVATWEASAAINALAVFPPYLFVGTPRPAEVAVLDLVHGLSYIDSFDAPGGSGNGKSLVFHNDSLLLGRTLGGNELYYLNAGALPGISLFSFQNINTTVSSIIASGDFLFLGTSDAEKEFQIWNRGTSTISFLNSIDFPSKILAMDCDQEVLYTLQEGNDPLRILYSYE
jgi:hypothetical protein